MKISYLIDTDWVINHLNKVDKVTQKLKELRPAGIALSVISLAELYEGVYYSKDPGTSQKILDTFLRDFQSWELTKRFVKYLVKNVENLGKKEKLLATLIY
jgi:predicted nucleic acid-binding protein